MTLGIHSRYGRMTLRRSLLVVSVAAFLHPLAAATSTTTAAASAQGGFYRLRQSDGGRWWVVEPGGRKTFLRGVDWVWAHGFHCEALGYSPYGRFVQASYPSREAWADETLSRLKSWGFNALGSGCSPELERKGLAHCRHLAMGESFCRQGRDCALGAAEGIPGTAFPNVFHPDFARFCDERAARACAPNRDDRSLFGYFFDNELSWRVRGSVANGLYDAAAKASAESPARKALDAFLVRRGMAAADAALVSDETKIDFLRLAAARYFGTIAAAIRRHDPNHLLLGCRFAGLGSAHRVVWEEAGKVCDAVTFNSYPWADIDQGVVYTSRSSGLTVAEAYAERYGWTQKPLMVTEWSFPALDSGLPCTFGAGQRFRTQSERTAATELFARTVLALPFVAGYDYFMWVDQPAQGISRKFPEDSNYGLVNERGDPYREITAMFARLHAQAEALHARGRIPAPKSAARTGMMKRFGEVVGGLRRVAAEDGTKPAPPTFVRDGERYALSSPSGLVLSGRIGGRYAFDDVRFRGEDYGSFALMVYHGDWQTVERVESAEWQGERGALRIAGTLRRGKKAFRVTCDIVPFVESPWFGCDIVSLENIGEEAGGNMSVFLMQRAPWAKEKKQGRKSVPDLWKAPIADAWIRAVDGAWCGAATVASNVAFFSYWVSPDGCTHADAKFAPPASLRLAPGERWAPNGNAWMVAAVGTGGEDGWRLFLDRFIAQMCKRHDAGK